ncbi:MAG: Ig-like domain-containing protein [Christensenellales bacterium]
MFKKFMIMIMVILFLFASCEAPEVIKKVPNIVIATEAAKILPKAAVLKGNILEIDADNILDYGFEWWSVNDSKESISLGNKLEVGTFSCLLNELSERIEYFYSAYVTVDDLTIYGGIKTFTLLPIEEIPLIEEIPQIIDVETIILNETELILNVEETFQLEAEILPENAEDKSFSWISSDPDIAEINETGLVTCKAIGIITIKAKANCNEKEGLCKILVRYPSSGDFAIDKLPEVAEKYTSLNITLPKEAKILNATSSDESVILILENTLNFIKDGESKIKIEYSLKDGKTKTIDKTIKIGQKKDKNNKDSGKNPDKEKPKTKWWGNPNIPEALWHIETSTWRGKYFDGVKHWVDDRNRHWLADGTYLYTESYIDPPPPPEWDDE